MIFDKEAGLFLVNYEIGSGLFGATSFKLSMTVFQSECTVNGSGQINQSTNPPNKVRTKFGGSFHSLTIADNEMILIKTTGYPVIHWPPQSGIGPAIMPNLELCMALQSDWNTGTANFKYRSKIFDGIDDWVEVKDVPVKVSANNALEVA